MYAIAILRYRRPLEEVVVAVDEHRAYLRTLKDKGILVASGGPRASAQRWHADSSRP